MSEVWWRPTRGRVAISYKKLAEDEQGHVKTEGGLYLPAKIAGAAIGKGREIEDPHIGTVVAVGLPQYVGGVAVEPEVAVGDIVKADRRFGTPVEESDEAEVRVFLFNEITAIRETE